MVCTGSSAPVDIWTFAPGDPAMRQLTRSPHPGVDLGALTRPSLEFFKAHDGLELSGWLYVPKGFSAPGPCSSCSLRTLSTLMRSFFLMPGTLATASMVLSSTTYSSK